LGTSRQQRQEITEEIKSLAQVKYGGGQQNTLGTDKKPDTKQTTKMRSCSNKDSRTAKIRVEGSDISYHIDPSVFSFILT
jgi:hypothetical protein